jgi:MraZ protein
MVLIPSVFQTLYDRLMAMSITDPAARLLRQVILGNAMQVVPDASGRILLSQNLREYAFLQDNVVFVGQGDHFEIWSAGTWQKQQDQINDSATNAQRFAALDLSTR